MTSRSVKVSSKIWGDRKQENADTSMIALNDKGLVFNKQYEVSPLLSY